MKIKKKNLKKKKKKLKREKIAEFKKKCQNYTFCVVKKLEDHCLES